MQFLQRLIENFIKEHVRRKRLYRVVSVLACIVVFVTTYAMILPAITLDRATAEAMLNNMLQRELMQLQTAKAIAAALSDRTLQSIEQERRDKLRADLFKNMIITLNN